MNPIFIKKEGSMATKGSWKKKKAMPTMVVLIQVSPHESPNEPTWKGMSLTTHLKKSMFSLMFLAFAPICLNLMTSHFGKRFSLTLIIFILFHFWFQHNRNLRNLTYLFVLSLIFSHTHSPLGLLNLLSWHFLLNMCPSSLLDDLNHHIEWRLQNKRTDNFKLSFYNLYPLYL